MVKIAQLSTRRPWLVLGIWGLVLLSGLPLALRVGTVLTSDVGAAPNSQAVKVRALLEQNFVGSGEAGSQIVLVADGRDSGLSATRLERTFAALLADLRTLPGVAAVQSSADNPLLPGFGAEKASLALVETGTTNREAALQTYATLRERLPAGDGVSYYLTGAVAVDQELQKISKQDALRAEVLGLSVSLVVLALVFGAVVAATLPLIVAVVSITLSLAALYLLGLVTPVASFALSVVSLLGLATGIDYALLIVNRYREELAQLAPRQGDVRQDGVQQSGVQQSSIQQDDVRQAVQRTTLSAGKAVVVSGLTVLVALSALLIPPLSFIRSIGAASIVVMFFSVAVSVTALPALLTLLGTRVNLLRLTRREPGTRSRAFWRARGSAIMRRPVVWTVLGVAALLAIGWPTLNMELGISGINGLTAQTETRQAQNVLERLGLADLEDSFDVLVDFGERGFYYPSSVRDVAQLTRAVEKLGGVAQVYSPTTATGVPALITYQYYATPDLAAASPLADLAKATVSRDGRYALLRVFPNEISPKTLGTLAAGLREATGVLGLNATFGGKLIQEQEWASTLYGSFPYAVMFVYLSTFVLLGLAFKSVLIPIKSILLNTLTVLAAFGAITAVFQMGFLAPLFGLSGGLGFVETSVPVFIFAVVFGLSMDYEVFLVSRIYEGHQRGLSDRDAVLHALVSTGNVISSAALIMVIVFSIFIFSHIVLIKTLSLGLSVAVLLDATLVRSALVPAMMLLMGKWNWWLPKPVARIAKRVDFGHD